VTAFGNTTGTFGAEHELTTQWWVISSIQLPNGTSYGFQYGGGSYGEITEIDLPTGGVITYSYANLQNSLKTRRAVASRTETANGVSSTWTFNIVPNSPSGVGADSYTSTVTYPAVGVGAGIASQSVFVSVDGAITDAKIYSSSVTGTPLREYKMVYATDHDPWVDDACYNPNGNLPPLVPQAVGQRLTSITTILENNLQSQKQYDYDTLSYIYHPNHCTWVMAGNDSKVAKTYTTSRGNVTEIREYDWGVGAPGALLRRTSNVYGLNSNSNYLSRNIIDKITQQTIYDGTGAQVAQTQYEYDNYAAGQNAMIGTSGAPAPQHDYTNYSTSMSFRGNVTRVKKWRNTDGAFLTTTYTYDDLGNVRTVQNPRGFNTTYAYTDRWANGSCPPASGNGQAYVTLVTNALSQKTQLTYFPCTGLTQAHQDQNDLNSSRSGTTFTYDLFGRTTQKVAADSGITSTSYVDSASASSSTSVSASPDPSVNTTSRLDGLGRVMQTELTSDPDPSGTTKVDTAYDHRGRKRSVSNPYRTGTEPTSGLTTYAYDALSRIASVTEPDGQVLNTTYTGNSTIVTDEAGRARTSSTDGIGRLANVTEDPGTGHLNYSTVYGYDALGNLKSVVQSGSHSRTFVYNSLSQLTSASNPESGTVTYAYDADGNVSTKTDARGVVTTYTYDQLDRLTQKTYTGDPSGTGPVTYAYDQTSVLLGTDQINIANGVGRLGWSRSGSTSQPNMTKAFSYDSVGRVTLMKENTPISGSADYAASFAYDLAGNPTSITYPSSRVVTFGYSGAGKATRATFASFSGSIPDPAAYNYVSGATYAPQGAPATLVLGSAVTDTSTYNKRLQPTNEQVGSSTLTTLYRSYSFYDVSAGNQNNGNVASITDNLNPGRTQTFTYDSLNRIYTAKTSATSGSDCWAQQFGYDAWGNLKTATPTQAGCTMTALNLTVDTNNRITNTGFSYDLSGDLLTDGSHNYAYDAEGRIKSVDATAATYFYDADGKRGLKTAGASTTEYVNITGEPLAERRPNGDWSDYVFVNGQRLVRADNYEARLHMFGTRCNGCGWTEAEFWTTGYSGFPGRVIKTGDKLLWRQWQSVGEVGGIGMWFTDGSFISGANDQDGQPAWADTIQGSWHYRSVDLSQFAGKTIDHWSLSSDTLTSPGAWDLYFEDVVMACADGTVLPIYTREESLSLTVDPYPGETGVGYEINHVQGVALEPSQSTTFYHGDYLGSARAMTNANGYPLWAATYLPFGQEWNLEQTVNNYKFTGKERDSESSLDYFGARYLSSAMGRWTSPDWSATPEAVPYVDMSDPQTLNLYGYVRNNPLSHADADGHCCAPYELADYLDTKINSAVNYVENRAIASGSPGLAATATFAAGATGDAGRGFTNLLRTGESVGSLPENASGGQIATALAEEGGRVGGTILAVVAVAGPSTPATAEQGAGVAGEIGQSRATLPNGSAVDLAGKAHFEKSTGENVATPHIKDPVYNTNSNTGVTYQNGYGATRPATVGDVNAAARATGATPPVRIPPPVPVAKKENQ
jgi:RHS repeat-associated protein